MRNLSLLLALVAVGVAQAQTRVGGRYSLAAEALGAAAGSSSSSRYSLRASAASAASVGNSSFVLLKSGFAGMLFEPAGLLVESQPWELLENATVQLAPFLVLDDATRLAVPADSVDWSVLAGPVQVDGTGLVSAGTVASDTSATLGAAHRGFSTERLLLLRNVNTDDFGSYAGDGLEDAWQVLHFGENNPAAAPTADPDGDGQDNLFEFTAGVLPTSAASLFRVRLEAQAGAAHTWRLVFSPRLEDRTYVPERATTPGEGAAWQSLVSPLVSDVGSERTIVDVAAPAPAVFYRVRVLRP